MKKILVSIGVIAGMAIASFCVYEAYAGTPIWQNPPVIVGDFDGINRCRCKQDGCYGGNAISFRASCAKSADPIQCADYDNNCP